MFDSMPIHDAVIGEMTRSRGPADRLDPRGVFHVQHVRDGVILAEFDAPNGVTNAAKNNLLDVFFNSATHTITWSMGLVDNALLTGVSAGDTVGGHSGWNEFISYTVGGNSVNRGNWGQGAAAGQAVTSSSPVVFDFTGAGIVWGVFIQSDTTKLGSTGLLWSTAAFNAPLVVDIGDQLRVTYTVQL